MVQHRNRYRDRGLVMAWIDKTAAELQVGDVLLNNGARVDQTVRCAHGASVYLRARFEDGYTQVVTVPADRVIPVWLPETATGIGG
jgi:hypothetical protein